ncbi:MAG: ABC transporter ATP-binding protein [Deltaproteobacteria bacterium]|nr:ABC transporter ATP-binding protein [Deltaproteobacteria bacterium]MBM4323681.1 ABC transporter ATP-binding protein [Deltaproteobacteria bacterium]MBM4346629.1 ABC transporter ATP-binding protein [Deltaproteobacteria bacterium]
MFLQTQRITKEFGKLRAVNQVSLDIRKGDIHAIIGPNGAGKSTYFNLVTGYHQATSGKVLFKGNEITHLPAFRRCKYGITRSFQITSIFPKFTVYESVLMGLLSHRGVTLSFFSASKKFFKEEVYRILEDVGLADQADTLGDSISHGDKKRLELGITLGTEPELLLLDEPTCGMSAEETDSIMSLINKLSTERGITILFTEHDMSVVFGIAKRISVLHQGTLIADGKPDEVRANEEVQKVYLGGTA